MYVWRARSTTFLTAVVPRRENRLFLLYDVRKLLPQPTRNMQWPLQLQPSTLAPGLVHAVSVSPPQHSTPAPAPFVFLCSSFHHDRIIPPTGLSPTRDLRPILEPISPLSLLGTTCRPSPPPLSLFVLLVVLSRFVILSQNLPKDALSNGVGLDQQPAAAASAPSAAVTTVAAAPRRLSAAGAADDQATGGSGRTGGSGSRTAHGGIASSSSGDGDGDGGRPSPVRVTKVFGRGLQVCVCLSLWCLFVGIFLASISFSAHSRVPVLCVLCVLLRGVLYDSVYVLGTTRRLSPGHTRGGETPAVHCFSDVCITTFCAKHVCLASALGVCLHHAYAVYCITPCDKGQKPLIAHGRFIPLNKG